MSDPLVDTIEEAKSSRASCKSCKKKIEKGTLRFGEAYESQFGDGVSYGWNHMDCAATRLAAKLRKALDAYQGVVADKDALLKKIEAGEKNAPKKKQFPYIEPAPSGRSKCMECEDKIAKEEWRVAVEREFDAASFSGKGAGYLHPGCAVAYTKEDDLFDLLQENSPGVSDDEWEELEELL